MTNKTIGFVGGERITRIFLEGWKRQDVFPTHITVSDDSVDAQNPGTLNREAAMSSSLRARVSG